MSPNSLLPRTFLPGQCQYAQPLKSVIEHLEQQKLGFNRTPNLWVLCFVVIVVGGGFGWLVGFFFSFCIDNPTANVVNKKHSTNKNRPIKILTFLLFKFRRLIKHIYWKRCIIYLTAHSLQAYTSPPSKNKIQKKQNPEFFSVYTVIAV